MEKASRTTIKPIVMTVRLGGRRMTLTWRPRKRVPGLLRALLARSLRSLAGVVLGGLSTAALAQIAANALPTGGQLVAGQAVISQLSNQMLVSQGSDKAIINWNTFNIGSAAGVNFQMPSSTSAVLNRVITNNPSSLLGTLTGNGRVWLINPAGIMVGPGATIDVGGFIGSTLNVRNEDFLADRLNFSGPGGAVSNFGRITTPQGGNVYLVGSSVENQGLIRSPGGEVLLAAGQTVEIGDTATPGVKVAITGTEGSVLNVGQVLAEAGRVGLAGALVRHSGTINASSVVREGGRVFLRATKTVITDADSLIDASGITGGDIRLVAEERAQINGSLVARGTEGRGGFVETSGKQGFSITRAPDLGPGGEWLIDPHNISIRAQQLASNVTDGPAFENTADDAVVTTDLLQAALDAGTNVSITTTAGGSQAGDINVHDAIVKSAGGDATLSLNAHNNINLDQAITATSGKLNVALSQAGTAALRSSIALNGGTLASSGRLVLAGATLDGVKLNTSGTGTNSTIVTDAQTRFSGGTVWSNTGLAEFTNNGSLLLDAGTSFQNLAGGTVNLTGDTYAAIASSGGTMVNAGILNKITPAVTVLEEFSNAGEVNVHAGTLRLAGNGKHGGSFNLLAGGDTMLSFAPGDGQTANLNGATVNMQSSEGTGLVDFSGSYGSTTILNNDLTLANARITGGTLSGTGKLSVTNFAWSGGTISGMPGNSPWDVGNLSLSGSTELAGRTLTLRAEGISSADGAYLSMRDGARLNNAGVLTLTNGAHLGAVSYYGEGVASEINNTGTIISTGGAWANSANYLGSQGEANHGASFNNSGTVRVSNSTLELSSGVHSGRFELQADQPGTAELVFGGGYSSSVTLEQGATISESSSNGGSTSVGFGRAWGSGTFMVNTDLTLGNLALSGGVLGGTGQIRATNFNWSGGEIRGKAGDPAYEVTNLTLTNYGTLAGRTLALAAGGKSTVSGAYLQMENGARLDNAGAMALTDGSYLGASGWESAPSEINNTGTILSTAEDGYGGNSIGSAWGSSTRFNNNGTVTVRDSSLNIGPGAHSGSFQLQASQPGTTTRLRLEGGESGAATIDFNAGATISESRSNGASTMVELGMYGGTTNINTDLTLHNATLNGGTLQGSGSLRVNDLAWDEGTIKGRAGDPAYHVKNLSVGGWINLDGRTLNLVEGGTSTLNPGADMQLTQGAQLNLHGLMTVRDGGRIGANAWYDTGVSEINNFGQLDVANSAGSGGYANVLGTRWDDQNKISFNNAGTVNLSDALLLLGPGNHSGRFNLNATHPDGVTQLFFGNGNEAVTNFNAGASIVETAATGARTFLTLAHGGGTTNLNTDLAVENASIDGGTLQGSGRLVATNLEWNGGIIAGKPGDSAFKVKNLQLSSMALLDGRRLELAGGTSNASHAELLMANGAQLDNAGEFNLLNGSRLGGLASGGSAGTEGTINNAGTINVARTQDDSYNARFSSYSYFSSLGSGEGSRVVSFNNSGVVNLNDGTLKLAGGTHSGTFNVNASASGPAILEFAASSADGPGAITLGAGTVINQNSRDAGIAKIVFAGNSTGAVNIDGNLSLQSASFDGGTLQGSGKLAVSSLDWSDGTIRGQSPDPAWDFGNINLSRQVVVDNRKINLGSGGASTAMADAGLSLLRGSVLTSNGSHSLGSISNQGSVLVASGTLSSTRLDNAGTIAVNGGALTVDGITTVDGILATSGDGSFTANGSVSGAGMLDVRGGSMTLNGPTQISDVSVSAGTLKGSGGLSANNLFFTGGTISGSEPDPAYAINNLLLSGTATLEGRTLNLQSGGNSTVDGGVLWMSSGARINNAGTLSLSNGSFLGFPVKLTGDSEINNSGTIISLADSSERLTNAIGGVAAVNESTTRFNNLSGGTVIVRDSTLELGPGTHNGSLQLDASGPGNAKLTFYHYGGTVDLNAGTTISESRSNGGLTTVQFGSTSSSSSGEAAGITRVNTDLSVNNAVLASGTLAGSGSFRAANLAWSGGAIRGSAGDAAFEVGNLDTQGTLALDGRTLNLLAGGTGSAAASSTLAITGSGVLNSTGNVSLGAIANAGSVNISGGRFGAASFSNTGLVQLANGATLAARDGFSNLEGGLLAGSGTVDTGQNSLVNNGRLVPGGDAGIGTLAVQGNLQQGATGVTEIELAGGAQFDRVAASGQLALDGTLTVSSLGAYAPAAGDSWSFLTAGGTRSGSFSATKAPSGIRAGYSLFEGEAARLTMLPSATTAYFNNAAGGLAWSDAGNWAGNVRPGASDDVWLNAGSTIFHAAGTDAIGKLTLANATALSVSGGSISVGGLTSIDGRLTTTGSGTYTANGNIAGSGMLQVAGGNLVLNGTSSMPLLAISAGSVSGSGSLTVTRNFSQTGGAINMPGAIVSLAQQTGNLVTGDIVAGELTLLASAGSIGQLSITNALRADELETTSAAGTVLNNAANKVRSFKAYNTGSGNISLVSVSSPSSLVLNGITNTAAGGNVSIDNTGGIVDNAPIVSRGKIALTAHSPITVNAPISAGSDVSLQAMSSTGGNDNLTINSSVSSTGGALQLSAGAQLAVTSAGSLSVPGGSTISLTSTGGTVSIADPASIVGATPVVTLPAPVTVPPVSTAPSSTTLAAVTTIVGTAIKSANPTATATNSIRNNTVVPTAPAAPSGSTSLASLGGQTVGGTADTFGGASSTAGSDAGSAGAGTASSTGFASTTPGSSSSSSSTQSSSTASDSSSSSSSPTTSSSSSSSSSTSADSGSGSKKDEQGAKEDKSEAQKPQLASKQARKSLPVCN
ncbi:beta strand repeat-containing protein [Lacisediminimonas profundi]|uniref:beta strand repeat-containing protein n=1 Tax=Lacisediminimonas profundi TaxID=2603856 RepID=UPI00124BC704|nr:filamentous hemagglutinin N-terminal domain-containing protein [Lacisediminimonas profundi]